MLLSPGVVPASSLRKLFYATTLLFLSGIFSFCLFYFCSGYETLKNWYFSFNPCFYKQETWASDFFTPDVKAKGNYLVLLGCILCISAIIYIVRGWRKLKNDMETTTPCVSRRPLGWYAAVIILGVFMGMSSFNRSAPSSDELFSAVNCAMAPAFRCISYYMLPNNHMYFNLLNHVLFGWSNDLVFTGRLISFAAYVGVLLCAFHWFCSLFKKEWLAFIAILPVALQFLVWGFATQARGYECQLLCGWVSFISIMKYARTYDRNALLLNTCSNIAGIALIPTFIYMLPAQVLFICGVMVYNRTMRWQYFKYQVIFCAFTFLLYLPGFCFSGVTAFTANSYVRPASGDLHTFTVAFLEYSKPAVKYTFSMLSAKDSTISFLLFLFPVLLCFSKQSERRLIGFFYVTYWLVLILFMFQMRRLPFFRNMITEYSLTMACIIYTFYAVSDVVANRLKPAFLQHACRLLWVVPLWLCCAYLFVNDREKVSSDLYFSNGDEVFKTFKAEFSTIPQGSSIGFRNDNFYFYYLGRTMHFKVRECAAGNEEYYIHPAPDPLPANIAEQYTFERKFAVDYELFKRK